MGLLEPMKYGEQFHKLYVNNCDNKKTTSDRSSKNRKKKSDKRKLNKQNDQTVQLIRSDQIELEPNASKFAIFSAVRSSVLESETKLSQIYASPDMVGKSSSIASCCCHCAATCKTGVVVECRCHHGQGKSQDNNDSENDSFTEETTEKDVVLQVPQIVGAGLRGLFELIAEARDVSPVLCTKALRALFDVIQGQIPESFKSEPNDLIQPLYDLLLDLATLHGPVSQSNDAANWSAVGCSALLGLCVARGDTGKTLKAISALLMSPKILNTQNIQLPLVLSTLQRSIYSVALGKPSKPDFFKNGIPRNSQIEQFSLRHQLPANIQYNLQPSIASNGKYIFILTGKSLIKIGSGFNGTLRGFVYAVNNEFGKEKNGWIGFCGNILFYKKLSKRSNESILIVSTETLSVTCAAQVTIPTTRDGQNCLLFSDGESLNAICTTKDDTLVVKQIYTTGTTVSDLPLKLARKSFRTLGYAAFEDEVLNQNQIQSIQTTFNPFEPKLPNDQDVVGISCGKEFGLVRAANGKVYYYGKAASLGLKSVGKTPSLRMTELIISKVSNIVNFSIGHDGIHAVLVNDDGTVYFAGTARRGEDGDTSKNRRQPKAVKPKKLSKIDSHFIVHVSCNNGTSAFVTKTGKLIMFGKDTAHCDSSGLVTDLLDQHITRVSLGKAHCVVLNSKGQVFTFGLNNKGQCGRQKAKDSTSTVSANSDTKLQHSVYKYDASNICDFDDHIVVQGQCRVCSICHECTGYNISCVSTQNTTLEHRIPGANCACGHGDAGCSKCGACSTCIAFQENESIHVQDGKEKRPFSFLIRQRNKTSIGNQKDKKLEDINHGSDVERDTPRVAPLPPQKISLPSHSPVVQISCGLHHTVVLTLNGEVFTFGSNQYGQLGTSDLQPHFGPFAVKVPGVVSQVAAGSNHTVLLTTKGVVYTFGNHQKGQLGRLPNDVQPNSNYPDDPSTKTDNGSEELAANVSHIMIQRQKYLWNCIPGAVFGIGPNYGKKATYISASGDQSYFKIDESLITGPMLSKVNIVADKNTILLIPQFSLSFNCLAICRRDGNCNAHSTNQVDFAKIIQTNSNAITQLASDKCNQNVEMNNFHQNQDRMSQSVHEARNQIFDVQENLKFSDHRKRKRPDHKSIDKIMPQLAFALDTCYGVLWVFDAISRKIMCYNVIASEISGGEGSSYLRAILSPELALPLKPDVQVTRSQASLNILACLDILTSGQDSLPSCFQQVRSRSSASPTKESLNTDFQIVSRFENFGGGWGYSGHSVEAIRFMADTDIQLCGFAMFGGRGEYTCKLKLFDLGCDGGGYEKDGILISETDEIPYECPARSKYNIMLPKPLTANACKWYLVWARISGPSSDCGSSGQSTVTTEDQIVFNFKTSKKANNGTDVNSGQIPSILYRIITQETKQPTISVDLDPVYKISRLFANTVTKECFESLVFLLNWAWMSFKLTLNDLKDKKKLPQTTATLNRLFYINKACLRLLRKYTNEIYPNNIFAKVEKHPSAANKKSETQIYVLNQGPSTSKNVATSKFFMGSSMEATTPTNPKKINMENLQLAETIGDVRSLLIQILSDEIPGDIEADGYDTTVDILDECHTTFLSCFNVFYPTSTLKWNCLCELLAQEEKGNNNSRLLSAIIAGLCHPNVKLRNTFSLLSSTRESKSIVSPSDNSGLPMLLSTENHQYPVLVEQMIYRTQREKSEFLTNVWTFKDVLIRILDIISHPIKSKIENIYNRSNQYETSFNKRINQKLIDNCCHLLARVLAEIVYQSCSSDIELSFLPTRSLLSTSSRFARCDTSRTWNTGNFGPDAISFSVNRPGIGIAGAMVYSGSGSYEYQLELLYDTVESQSQHKWETLESVSGTYDQDIVHNDMAEIKFDRPVHIKENTRYAIRLCSQGARTCSGDAGLNTVRGQCGCTFSFFPCDLSFNGTTPARGQIPCLLYYSTPLKNETHSGKVLNELHARDITLQIASDITKKCTELLILARNTLAASISPSEKSLNSSNNTQTIDSEQNITPIEEHLDVTFANNSNNTITNTPSSFSEHNVSTARDLSKRIESFSKGIMETLKFDKRSTNPFEFEIEIGATEIHPKDLVKESEIQDKNLKNGRISKMNGNNSNIKNLLNEIARSGSEEDSSDFNVLQTLKLFENKSASMFHTLLPLVFAHIGALASSDPKSSVQILSLIRDILPHVSALNQLYCGKDKAIDPKDCVMQESRKENFFAKDLEDAKQHLLDLNTTSNHYCIIESDHPYKSASISSYRVEFPPCVQWFTVEFDHQCGTAQPEDYLVVSIPTKPSSNFTVNWDSGKQSMFSDGSKGLFESYHSDKFSICKNACITSYASHKDDDNFISLNSAEVDDDRFIVKVYNTTCQWSQNALVLPGNKIDFSLETASNYARDQQANKYGFRCLIVGYENPTLFPYPNSSLTKLECELAYLGGMCTAHLMKKDLMLPGDNPSEDFSNVENTITAHAALLSKGLAISDSVFTVNQALDSYLPISGQSNEKQFLKDFVNAAPGSSGARLAAWLQPEPRLDPNKCELKPILESVRYGWPTQLNVICRDQYGDAVYIPDIKIEIKATPSGGIISGSRKAKKITQVDHSCKSFAIPPKIPYEPTIKDKMCCKAITFMKAYQPYSFEELRFISPTQTRVSETLIARDMGDLTFGALWTPNYVGNFCITITIDGITLEEVYRVDVKEAGVPPPPQKPSIKKTQPPNKLRKFIAKNSAGLRIRSHPTLQSDQVGIVKMDGIISFIDEVENDDGIWVRLSTESIRQHCAAGWYPSEAWCLQYNQHLGKTLLHPIIEPHTTKIMLARIRNNSQSSIDVNDLITDSDETVPPLSVPAASPSKKSFDFSSAKFTPPIGPNSFIFPQPTASSSFPLDASENVDPQHHKFDEIKSDDELKTSDDPGEKVEGHNSAFGYNQASCSRDDEDKHSLMQTPQSSVRNNSSGSSLSISPNQSNLGNTIAGVVGGGASKLQALHKWFKGDSFDGKDFSKKRNELSELASVSVRDLVKAIGGQDSKSNGNESTPPHHSRSSSPVAVPVGRHDQHSAHGSCSKSIEISDSSILVSSFARDLSQSPSQSSFRDEAESFSFADSQTSQTEDATAHTIRNFPSSCTPKHSPRKMRNKRSAQGYFCNNSSSFDTKENDQHAGKKPFSFGSDQNKSNLREHHNDINNTTNVDAGRTAKRALPSSLAESLRAVFAAFLWHEGIVHDAMACSSFLKFHPTLPKNRAFTKNPSVDGGDDKVSLSKEQRAQQRYSVEVANAGNYLNIRPSTLETLTKSGNSSVHNRRYRKNGTEEQPKLHALPELMVVCPPALKCLVYLWDQLCSNCIQVVQSTAADQQKDVQSPPVLMNPSNEQNISDDSKKNKKKKKDDGTWCELCEIFLPIPVTYHMRIVHPGCGKPAKGKGYNSVGTFCEGWAGNCGEGGKGASSWYLMCDQCREKYMVRNVNINNINTTNTQAFHSNNKLENLFGMKSNMILNSEVYSMMKENSMFLLELSSTGSGGLIGNQKRSPQQMPVVTETQLHQIASDLNKPSTSRGDINSSVRNSKVMLAYNIGSRDSIKGPTSSTPYRRSDVPTCISPELLWQAPDTFSCLESLGASMTNDTPYTIFGLNSTDNGFERPLSEISIDSMDRSGMLTNSMTNTNSLSRFHRSMSMGQGWPNQEITSKYMPGNNDSGPGQNSKVILRRRNNSTCDDGGSLLLCHPSENLRKLVPESIFQVTSNLPVPPPNKTKPDIVPPHDENEQIIPINKDNTDKSKNLSLTRNEGTSAVEAIRKTSKSDKSADAQPLKTNNVDQNICLLSRPTMVFILEQHNLEKLRYSLKRSLRVATARIYSLQALNWLMRSVTQTSCLHDLMWWFVTSLKPASDDISKNDETEQALEHPVSSTQMCGKISLLLTQSFHTFLQTVADLTLLLPPGSALQQIAVQCFGIKFRQADHQFLHRSHVFGNISKILSRSDEQNEEMLLLSSAAMLESNPNFWVSHLNINHETRVSNLVDLAGMFEVTVSSRQTMNASLTDGSTETFWESDEEDRNKSKIIEISMNKLSFLCKMIFVHIDNSRDIQNKVTNVSFYGGQSLGDTSLIKSVEVDSKSGTWISANVRDESWTHFRLEFRGPENTLRVRQVKLLGVPVLLEEIHQRHNPKLTNAFQIQQRNCESETLRVFRLITAQVFGKLILGTDHHNTENFNLTTAVGMESSSTSLLADSLDLREHMVGILFSRSKLSHLQKQVIVHIVHAIRKETQRAKEEWEILNSNTNTNNITMIGNFDEKSDSSSENSRAPDTYCFEMLSMVLALSGSTVGRSYLSHQYSLLKDLLSLLHTGSDRVQRQVTSLLRRILPEITPENLGDLLGIQVMPPNDFSIVNQNTHTFDMNRLGIIDIFLAVIAKALQLQIKIKTVTAPMANKQITTAKLCNCIDLNVHNLKSATMGKNDDQNVDDVTDHLFDFNIGENSTLRNLNEDNYGKKSKDEKNLNELWFMKGSISVKQAENIISIIRDMASGKFSEKWSLVTKAAIAEAILNLTRLDEVFRTNDNCVKTATLWLALASLCVLDKDHVDRLSSGQWSKSSETRPLCSNHDDGTTPAVIQCEACGSLCGDCDRFLHLNRKTRNHHRTLCKEEEEAIRVELHESCGRTKLFWLLALADSKTLKAMVEFRDGNNAIISGPSNSIGRCRFCGVTGNSGLLAIGNVCADAQCQEHAVNTCTKSKPCGHACGGVTNEIKCLPCLQLMCNDRACENTEPSNGPKLTQDADDMCMICFVEALSCAPAIQLDCGHVFHYHCCKTVLQKRWTGPRISFGFSQCPICKIDIAHTLLSEVLEPIISLKNDVKRKAMMRLEYEGIIKTTDHKDLAQYAMDRYAYYVCFKCQKAYYGGEARCDAEIGDKYDPEELVCGGCSDVARAQMCPKHGTDFLEYKCRYCCSVAVFFCFGTTHFCDTCHDDFQRLTNIAKNKLPRCPAGPKAKQLMGDDCPLHVIHPQTGEEFALGCGICRNAQTF